MTLDVASLMKKITAPNNILKGSSKARAGAIYALNKRQLKRNFDKHPVTREIKGGKLADNISGTLSFGNLFSFIGFIDGTRPTEDLWDILDNNISFNNEPDMPRVNGNRVTYSFMVSAPSLRDIYSQTPYPSEKMKGGSWVQGIEDGIPFADHYLFSVAGFGKFTDKSRSKTGLQFTKRTFGNSYSTTPYVRNLLKNFQKSIGQFKFGSIRDVDEIEE